MSFIIHCRSGMAVELEVNGTGQGRWSCLGRSFHPSALIASAAEEGASKTEAWLTERACRSHSPWQVRLGGRRHSGWRDCVPPLMSTFFHSPAHPSSQSSSHLHSHSLPALPPPSSKPSFHLPSLPPPTLLELPPILPFISPTPPSPILFLILPPGRPPIPSLVFSSLLLSFSSFLPTSAPSLIFHPSRTLYCGPARHQAPRGHLGLHRYTSYTLSNLRDADSKQIMSPQWSRATARAIRTLLPEKPEQGSAVSPWQEAATLGTGEGGQKPGVGFEGEKVLARWPEGDQELQRARGN